MVYLIVNPYDEAVTMANRLRSMFHTPAELAQMAVNRAEVEEYRRDMGILVCKVCKAEYTVEAGECTNCQCDMDARYHHFGPDN